MKFNHLNKENFNVYIGDFYFMKKAILTLILFLAVGIVANAQTVQLKRHAVGTGGFVSKTSSVGKMSGLFGQAITGKVHPTIEGKTHTMYLGFWYTSPDSVGNINEDLILQMGIYNYPNPVMDVTNFNFNLSEPSLVTIRVYNSLGSLVATAAENEMLSEGINSIPWNARNANMGILSSDSYLYEMTAIPMNSLSKAKPVSFRNIMVIAK